MANKKFIVKLDADERTRLNDLISKGKAAAKTILKARILLKADQSESGEGWPDEKIAKALDTNITMVQRVRAKLVQEGLDATLARKKRETPPIAPIFDGEKQAHVIALACSQPPPPCTVRALPAGRSGCWPKRSWSARSCRPRISIRLAGR